MMMITKAELELFMQVSQTLRKLLPEGTYPSVTSTEMVQYLVHDDYDELLTLIARPHSERSNFFTIEVTDSLGYTFECLFDKRIRINNLLAVAPTSDSTHNNGTVLLAIAVKAITTAFGDDHV